MLIKEFRLFTCSDLNNPLDTILQEIGVFELRLFRSTGVVDGNHRWTLPSNPPDLSVYAEDGSLFNGTLLAPGTGVEYVHPLYELLLPYVSIRILNFTPSTTQCYLVAYNESGKFMYSFIPGGLSGVKSGALLTLINNVGQTLSINFSLNAYEQNTYDRQASFCGLICTINNDEITDIHYTSGVGTGNYYSAPQIELNTVSAGTVKNNTIAFLNACKTKPSGTPDPYLPGGHSGGGGGTGRFSRTGDTIGEHNVPTLSAVDAGFITLFAPTAGEMKALASYLWSDLFSIDTFKKIFANPMDAILGLSIVPVSVPTSGSASVKVGNISTGVSMTKASTQYVKLSCGSLEIEEYWGAYLDYSPYTKCEIYLPYIGVHELSVDDVMGKTVKVVYYIDILSGACTAEIYSNNTCLYSFVGQCSASIPITGNDWTNVINGVMQIGASIGSMVASGGLTAPISAGGVASGLKSVASASSTVTSSKPSVERSGSMSGAGGMLGQQTPYLIITWPRECIPENQNKYIGYPSFVTVNLGDIVGFNTIESVHLENIPATSAELDEIESLLMNGVIF